MNLAIRPSKEANTTSNIFNSGRTNSKTFYSSKRTTTLQSSNQSNSDGQTLNSQIANSTVNPTVDTLLQLHSAHQRIALASQIHHHKSIHHHALVMNKGKSSRVLVKNYNKFVIDRTEELSKHLISATEDPDIQARLGWIHKQFPEMKQRLEIAEKDRESSITVWENFFKEAKTVGLFNGQSEHEIARLYLQYADRWLVILNCLKEAHFDELHELTINDRIESIAEKKAQLKELFNTPVNKFAGYRLATTAHPTHLKTAAIVEIEKKLIAAIVKGDNYEIEQQIISLGRTRFNYSKRRTPLEEARAMLNSLGPSLLASATKAQIKMEDASGLSNVLELRSLYTLGTWALADRDGNPFVTADFTYQFALEKSQFVLRNYINSLETLWEQNFKNQTKNDTITAQFHTILTKLYLKLKQVEEELIPLQQKNAAKSQNPDESPYQDTDALEAFKAGDWFKKDLQAYADIEELKSDLIELHGEVGSQRPNEVREILTAVKIFGFHLSSAEIRQNTRQHSAAISEIIAKILPTFDYASLQEEDKLTTLAILLQKGNLDGIDLPEANRNNFEQLAEVISQLSTEGWKSLIESMSETTQETLATLSAIPKMQAIIGPEACDTYIMSNTESGKRNVRELLALQSLACPGKPLEDIGFNIIPLIETPTDLAKDNLTKIIDGIFDAKDPFYAKVIQKNGKIIIMLGPSDSGIRIGTPATMWAIYKAVYLAHKKIKELNKIRGFENVTLEFYIGSGGATSRGGLNVEETLKMLKAELEDSMGMRKTVQGQEAYNRLGNAKSAEYYLLKAVNALLEGIRDKDKIKEIPDNHFEAIDAFMVACGNHFSATLFNSERFAKYYFRATPGSLSHNFGSRPNKHVNRETTEEGENLMESVRAIPAVENFARNAQFIYLWYGVGTALKEISPQHFATLKKLAASGSSSHFNTSLQAIEYGLAYTKMFITQHLGVEDSEHSELWNQLNDEYNLACTKFKELTGRDPKVAPSINRIQQFFQNDKLPFLRRSKSARPAVEFINQKQIETARLPVASLIQYALHKIRKIEPQLSTPSANHDPLQEELEEWKKIAVKAMPAMANAVGRS